MRAALFVLLLSGCASMYGVPTMPSSELAKAVADGGGGCYSFPTPWGPGKALIASTEKGVIRNGGIEVTATGDCSSVKITNTVPPK